MESKKNKKNSNLTKAVLIGTGVGTAVGLAVAGSTLAIASGGIATPAIPVSLNVGGAIIGSWTALANTVGKAAKNASSLEERIGKLSWTINSKGKVTPSISKEFCGVEFVADLESDPEYRKCFGKDKETKKKKYYDDGY